MPPFAPAVKFHYAWEVYIYKSIIYNLSIQVTVKEFKTKAVKVDFEMNAHETLPGKIGTYRLNVTNLARGTEYEINVQALSELGRSVISTVQGMTEGLYFVLRV